MVPVNNPPDKWLTNLTSKELPQNVSNVLALRQKFNVKQDNKSVNTAQIIANVEPEIQKLGSEAKTELRLKLANIITNFKQMRTRYSTKERFLKEQLQETKTYLKDNDDILVVNADKGNTTVIITKEEYHQKMMSHLNDRTTYEVLNKDPTESIERKVNALLTKWENNQCITPERAKWLRSYTSVNPKIYLQIKHHKEGNPGRPIVSFVNAPTYNLSKMYSSIIKNVVGKTNKTVKNSREFKTKISRARLPKNYELASLDATSLFTNVSKELTLKAVNKKWNKINKCTNTPKDEFVEGLSLVLDNCCF